MAENLKLYYAPDNASLCVRLLLERLDQPYETILVDRSTKGQKDPAYLALNPNGLIPTLLTPKEALFETGAILNWLADQYPGHVFPAVEHLDRGAALTAMFWLSNTMHPSLRHVFYADQYAPDPKAFRKMAKVRAVQNLDIAAQMAPLIARHDALACYLVPMLRWIVLYGGRSGWLSLDQWPELKVLAARFEQNDFAARAALAEGLGPHPFTNPEFPNPPEGSAV